MSNIKSFEFEWDENDFKDLINSCQKDDAVKLSLQYLTNKNLKILEAGCGSGRVVKYLSDLGYKNVYGIEINKNAVNYINKKHSELKIIQGDILNTPYKNNEFDVIVSYGVVEHFPDGVDIPLRSLYQILKPNGTAIITVPSYNFLRRLKHLLTIANPRKNYYLIKFLTKNSPSKKNKGLYHVEPQCGEFFEYRLTKKQFELECKKVGFKIIKSIPICHIDGIYHIFNPILGNKFIEFKNWKFKVSKNAKLLNNFLKKMPFLHNHMHACVLKKM